MKAGPLVLLSNRSPPELVPVVELHFPNECLTWEVAHQLIRERCMKDMHFDPEPPTSDNPPVDSRE